MPVVGVDPSVDPLVYVSFNENWQPFIVGVIESLLDEDTWAGSQEEIDEAYEHVNQLFTRFVDMSLLAYPTVSFFPIGFFKVEGLANPWVFVGYPGQFLDGYWVQTTPAQYDHWVLTFPHKAGTYQFALCGPKYLHCGMTKIRVNGVWDEGSLFDWYDPGVVLNTVQSRAITFAEDGEQTVEIFVWDKNPLSSNYYVQLTSFGVWLYI